MNTTVCNRCGHHRRISESRIQRNKQIKCQSSGCNANNGGCSNTSDDTEITFIFNTRECVISLSFWCNENTWWISVCITNTSIRNCDCRNCTDSRNSGCCGCICIDCDSNTSKDCSDTSGYTNRNRRCRCVSRTTIRNYDTGDRTTCGNNCSCSSSCLDSSVKNHNTLFRLNKIINLIEQRDCTINKNFCGRCTNIIQDICGWSDTSLKFSSILSDCSIVYKHIRELFFPSNRSFKSWISRNTNTLICICCYGI